ncbi:Os01g0612350 [Oryza sativa Japonica Group]|uniref:Os01g0612350 protein n=1 Tax=Oryza sativa subsp. japonica TaxID=39947 RepID=A0A0N7KDB2_ORYSJ|nr:hypothetical protein EE612_004021 [Oryza sativa]BAS73129.1 Os01g0612350 [Oryza sativa Japonica Group]
MRASGEPPEISRSGASSCCRVVVAVDEQLFAEEAMYGLIGRKLAPPPFLHLVFFFGTALIFYFSKFMHLKFIHLKFTHLKFRDQKFTSQKFIYPIQI